MQESYDREGVPIRLTKKSNEADNGRTSTKPPLFGRVSRCVPPIRSGTPHHAIVRTFYLLGFFQFVNLLGMEIHGLFQIIHAVLHSVYGLTQDQLLIDA